MHDILDSIKTVAIKRFVRKRTILFYQGEIPRSALVLKSGVLKVYSVNTAGEEQIVMFHTAGDIFPTPWIFGESSNTLYYYEALTDCEVLAIPKADLLDVFSRSPELKDALFRYFVKTHTGLLLRITALEQSRANEKILFTLYYLMFRYGKEVSRGKYSVTLSLTHSIIASLVGLTRETTATELNKLKKRGIVDYNTHDYTINKEALERFLGEDSFKDLSLV